VSTQRATLKIPAYVLLFYQDYVSSLGALADSYGSLGTLYAKNFK
jgi:hypothetical protein